VISSASIAASRVYSEQGQQDHPAGDQHDEVSSGERAVA
jgi:hypothetical protein